MEDTGSYEALSAGDELGGEIRSPEGQPRALKRRRVRNSHRRKKRAWEIGCRSSCLRWVDWLSMSRMVVISRWLGSSSEKSPEKYADGDEV